MDFSTVITHSYTLFVEFIHPSLFFTSLDAIFVGMFVDLYSLYQQQVEGFWVCYCHLARPSSLPSPTDLHLFKQGIIPLWEDSANCNGGKIREVLKLDEEMTDLARSLISEQSLLMFGRGYNCATALEGALKIKEVALMHSERILAGEMKHGPLALVDENLPIIVIATHDQCFRLVFICFLDNLVEARKGHLIVMRTEGDTTSVCGGSCRVIEVPLVGDCLQHVVNIVPLQLLAYHLTVIRGYNVDQPRI
ncbi:glutamine--fructose-6-phosphate aminotransferase [isomerizing] 2 [Tanacetum coccineum]